MFCANCGSETEGKFCSSCGTAISTEPTPKPKKKSNPGKTLWFVSAGIAVLTAGFVLWQFSLATGAAAAYESTGSKIASGEAAIVEAEDANQTAQNELSAVMACNEYFGSDCSWVLGGSFESLSATASEAQAEVDALVNKLEKAEKQSKAAKAQVATSNGLMTLGVIIGGAATLFVAGLALTFQIRAKRGAVQAIEPEPQSS